MSETLRDVQEGRKQERKRQEQQLKDSITLEFKKYLDYHKYGHNRGVYGWLAANIRSYCSEYTLSTRDPAEAYDLTMREFKRHFYAKILTFILDNVCNVGEHEQNADSQLQFLAAATIDFRLHARRLDKMDLIYFMIGYRDVETGPMSMAFYKRTMSRYLYRWGNFSYSDPDRMVNDLVEKVLNGDMNSDELFKFSLLHRFYAICHQYDPDRAYYFRIANFALSFSTALIRQGAEWIINAGEDLATACLCHASLLDTDRIFVESSYSHRYNCNTLGSQVFNLERWEEWRSTLKIVIIKHEYEIEDFQRRILGFAGDISAPALTDLKSLRRYMEHTLDLCKKALRCMYELDARRMRVQCATKAILNGDDHRRSYSEEVIETSLNPIPPSATMSDSTLDNESSEYQNALIDRTFFS
ncbi:hypothetical protein GGS21DRAFT_545248 [Xylaria nigripes]|nr:hypothetical protein GGS21DRAFT_545248 [Xylaria nigripes]